MPLEHTSSPGRAVARRSWYRPAYEPLPPEPGRLVVNALLVRARRARGCVTPGDDRLETRVYAVKRYLFRLGHAARSARFATSVEQLVVGLAPVMGWGKPPRRGAERARFVRAHRKSVQRWLDDLEAAGIAAHEPERDQPGRWWRTQLVLLAAPTPDVDELELARARAHAWRARERRRRRGRPRRSLTAIRRRSATPGRRLRARLGRARAASADERRRRAAIEHTIAAGREFANERRGLLTHPFGAPPTSARPGVSPKRQQTTATSLTELSAAVRSARAFPMERRSAAGTGARARAAGALAPDAASPPRKECSEEITRRARDEFDALVLRRVAERERHLSESVALRRRHVLRRSQEVMVWPRGRACPLGRLKEAWLTHRRGADAAAAHGSRAAGPGGPALARRAAWAIALYEAYASERPPGWPTTGPAALCALAGQRRAAVLAGDVARLLAMAKGMRACALLADADRVARAAVRARRRRAAPAGLARLGFRTRPVRQETAEQRRVRVRDELLLSGDDPAAWPNAALAIDALERRGRGTAQPELTGPDMHDELDGIGARAARYRVELARGRWALPSRFASNNPQPTEASE